MASESTIAWGPPLTMEEYNRRFGPPPDIKTLLVDMTPEEAQRFLQTLHRNRMLDKGLDPDTQDEDE